MILRQTGLILAFFLFKSGWAYKIGCEEGWSSFSESPSCYFFSSKDETFADAKEICENYDAHLAIIESVPEKDHLATLTGQVTRKYAWLGLTKWQEDGQWHWLDNTTINENIM